MRSNSNTSSPSSSSTSGSRLRVWCFLTFFVACVLCLWSSTWLSSVLLSPPSATDQHHHHSTSAQQSASTTWSSPDPNLLRHVVYPNPFTAASIDNPWQVRLPAMLHQTVKRKSRPHHRGSTSSSSCDANRWSQQCHHVNHEFDFFLYDDDDLEGFVRQRYPQYYSLYRSLHGICKCLSWPY